MSAAKREAVYLLDVSFFTFRAYHALPPLTTSAGLPTNAVHGVVSMLEKLVRTEKPRYLGACFDAPGPSFRNEFYPDYKANRAEPDEELRVQFPYIRRIIDAMSIRCIEIEGFEADDLLATLARRFSARGRPVVIVTGDKDLMQCVNDRVHLYDPMRDLRIGPEEVVEKFGVPPEAVVDVQGLMGDSTDNIPGVRGVGPKTAAALIQHFGSLERVLKSPEEIENLSVRGAASVRAKIEKEREQALISKRLATIRSDVPIDVKLSDLAFRSPHTTELLAIAEELEMGRLARRLRDLFGIEEEPPARPAKSHESDEAVGFGADVSALEGAEVAFVLHEEDDGDCCLAAAAGKARAFVRGDKDVARALSRLAATGSSLSGFDVKALCRRFDVDPGPGGIDVGVASYLCDPSIGGHGREAVLKRFLGEAPAATGGGTPAAMATALDQVQRLIPVVEGELEKREQAELYRSIEHPLIGVLARIEARGILLDVDLLGRLAEDFDKRMKVLVEKIYAAAGSGFNILSPVQLREVLFERLGLPTKGLKKTKTGPSTDSDSLQALAPLHPLPALVLEYRGLAKLKSTYVDSLPRLVDEDGRIHTTLNQTVTATGRLSSSDPNLQNIPVRSEDGAKIRRAFIAPPGYELISADYNQIELRVLAHLSGDDALRETFRSGRDIHATTAAEVFGVAESEVTPSMRRAAKVINFGIIYGMGPARMSRDLGISRAEATAYIERYFARYPGVRRFYADTLAAARRDGYVSTLLGRRRYLPDLESENGGKRQAAERMATNTPIQGSAADIIKLAMVRLHELLGKTGLDAHMVLQIHDELLLEASTNEAKRVSHMLRDVMEGAVELAVPVVVDVGRGASWAEAHE